MSTKRVHYIDNLRWICVSLLVIYHAAMAYNTWGELNYIHFGAVKPLAAIVVLISPWFMPLMFLLAGISASYSLKKRGYGKFILERFTRLGIPLVIGLIINAPVLSYIADISRHKFQGNFIQHYVVYFSRFTDLTGYDGGFTFGHLWFLLVLIVVSLVSCIAIRFIPADNKTAVKITGIVLAIGAVASFDFKTFGKPLITYLCCYLLGYFIFSNQDFIKKLSSLKWEFIAVFVTAALTNALLYVFVGTVVILSNVCNYTSFICGVIALMIIGREYLDFEGMKTAGFPKLSYSFYIVHFPVVVLSQYFLNLTRMNTVLNFFLTVVISYPVTYLLCKLFSKIKSYYF